MEIDPHTLQQILQRIHQQMRCPQCGKRVPVDFSSVQVVASEALLLQIKCETCNAYIVLHASLQGGEQLKSDIEPKDFTDFTANVSSSFEESQKDVARVREALEKADGSFKELLGGAEEGSTEIA